MKALVYKSTGSWYVAKDEAGKMWNCRMKGIFKIDEITSTNPIAVGDYIEIEPEKESTDSAIITSILPRNNYINRQSPRVASQHHIVASNLNQAILLVTMLEPRTSSGYIDRFLIVAEAYHIPTVLIFNKSDLFKKKDNEKYLQWKAMYEAIGYPCHLISLKNKIGLDNIQNILSSKTTLLIGHSGVGKTAFINFLMPELNLKTQTISGWSGKGMHTTTYAEMYDLPFDGKIIDVPGMKEFGIIDITPQELSHYFIEMRDKISGCRFNNCLHINEPDCAIRKAVDDGIIHPIRYQNYCTILASLDETRK